MDGDRRELRRRMWPVDAFEAYRSLGVADEACFPYDPGATACAACSDWANRATRITGHTDLTNNPAAIKDWISTRGPVSACFYVYDDFFSYRFGVYRHVTGDLAGGHCVMIAGYDDAGGYWLCKNSWARAGATRAGSPSPTATPSSTRGT